MSNENGRIWVNDPADPQSDPLVELEDAAITAERTDDDEVAIRATLNAADDVLVLYLTPAEGALLAARLVAVCTPVTYAEAARVSRGGA